VLLFSSLPLVLILGPSPGGSGSGGKNYKCFVKARGSDSGAFYFNLKLILPLVKKVRLEWPKNIQIQFNPT